jgi:Holliday junction resolvase RusA-like endonuclease
MSRFRERPAPAHPEMPIPPALVYAAMSIQPQPYIVLRLALPPSANDLWTVRSGRMVKTSKYRKWMKIAAWEVLAQRKQRRIADLFAALIRVPLTGGDLDNRIKATLDACQEGGAVRNDRDCRQLMAEVHGSLSGEAVIWLWPVEPAEAAPPAIPG